MCLVATEISVGRFSILHDNANGGRYVRSDYLGYSRLPISNPRVINRTEVEVPYLGD